MNLNITDMPSTSRQCDSSPTTTNNNNDNSSNSNNHSINSNNHSENHYSNSHSSFSNSSFSSNNHSNSSFSSNNYSNDEMDTQDLTPTPETRTRELSIYDFVPKSKKKQQYVYWKMLKEQENMQSCLKMFKNCHLEEDTKFKHFSTSTKDSTGTRLKRKLAQKKRDRLFFGAASTGRVSQHRPGDHQQSSDTFWPPRNEDLPNLPPLATFTMLNDVDEPIYFVDNNNSK